MEKNIIFLQFISFSYFVNVSNLKQKISASIWSHPNSRVQFDSSFLTLIPYSLFRWWWWFLFACVNRYFFFVFHVIGTYFHWFEILVSRFFVLACWLSFDFYIGSCSWVGFKTYKLILNMFSSFFHQFVVFIGFDIWSCFIQFASIIFIYAIGLGSFEASRVEMLKHHLLDNLCSVVSCSSLLNNTPSSSHFKKVPSGL